MVGRWACLVVGASLLACGNYADVKPVEYDDISPPDHGGCHDTSSHEKQAERSCVPLRDDLDILFVVDDSRSMLDEQERISANFAAFIDHIDAFPADVDYRIGITTTDDSNPLCGGTTTPTAGQFVLSSCRERIDDFVDTSQQPAADASAEGCTDRCPYDASQLDDRMLPTMTDLDPEARVRPWIERIDGVSNLPPGVSPDAALACFGPQGVTGCGFESHLESMYKALNRARTPNEAAYGFLRDWANLLVVFVTDEVDCSYRNEFDHIFLSDGGRVFWSDPETPTSGICWNAGVRCLGGPGQYDDCVAADRGIDGLAVDDPALAVLHPVDRYADFLEELQQQKQQLSPQGSIFVSVIGGVPVDYATGAPISFADDPDPQAQAQFGIGPSCTSDEGAQTARPPVRLHALVDARGDAGGLFSICADDFSPALDPALDALDRIRPACYRDCVADTDADTEGLQPRCVVEAEIAGETVPVEPCVLEDGEWALPADDVDLCYAFRTDATQSGHDADDLADECIEDGSNLQFELLRGPGLTDLFAVWATCEPSDAPELDCPDP